MLVEVWPKSKQEASENPWGLWAVNPSTLSLSLGGSSSVCVRACGNRGRSQAGRPTVDPILSPRYVFSFTAVMKTPNLYVNTSPNWFILGDPFCRVCRDVTGYMDFPPAGNAKRQLGAGSMHVLCCQISSSVETSLCKTMCPRQQNSNFPRAGTCQNQCRAMRSAKDNAIYNW